MDFNKEKDYKEERFEFALYVNDNIICKRNFRIFNFIENSMNTLEFKEKVDEIVEMIDDDLKSRAGFTLGSITTPSSRRTTSSLHHLLVSRGYVPLSLLSAITSVTLSPRFGMAMPILRPSGRKWT